MYAEDHEKYRTEQDAFIYIAVNAHWEEHTFNLPIIPENMTWHLSFKSDFNSYAPGEEPEIECQTNLTLGPRSTAVLVAY
jgi:glycogen operon protein